MEYLHDAILLCIVVVNITFLMATCLLNTGTAKKPKKKNMVATCILLIINLVFDIVCQIGFSFNGVPENGIVILFFGLITVFLLYEAIKEIKQTSR